MCKVLQISRSSYYYEEKVRANESKLVAQITEFFRRSRNNYGTRKIKVELKNCGYVVSRRRIGRIMKQEGLVSNYTTAQFKVHRTICNEAKIENIVERQFDGREHLNVVESDLTYVRVGNAWNYICILVDLFNREIIGYSAGRNKDALLVNRAFTKVNTSLNNIQIFHTDRGNEFKN